jgi:hypothetical protein
MNKSLFYFLAMSLAVASLIVLSFSAYAAQPMEFFTTLIICIVGSVLLYTILSGGNLGTFILLLLCAALCVPLLGFFSMLIQGAPATSDQVDTGVWIYGTRMASILCTLAVLILGDHQIRSEEKKAKAKAKEEKV